MSAGWGSDRGTVVDRYYINRFFESHSRLIHGHVLEVRDPQYVDQFGSGVTRIDIVDIDPRNDKATIVADLAEAGSLPAATFDCAVIAQTLVYVRDPLVAIENVWGALAPGGVLLLTTPAIARLDPFFTDDDRWHLTPTSLRELLERGCDGAELTVQSFGNPLTAIAFLHGIAAEELDREKLDSFHPLFPIVVAAVAVKRP